MDGGREGWMEGLGGMDEWDTERVREAQESEARMWTVIPNTPGTIV